MDRLINLWAFPDVAFLGMAAWIYFGGRTEVIIAWFGSDPRVSGNLARRIVLFSFSVILFLRICLTLFYLLKRRFGWEEFWGVVFALFLYHVVFAVLGGSESRQLNALDVLAIAIFLVGSYLNTGSELQRKKFKEKPGNQGILYTEGLFQYARHINYFGDTLWVTAWAVMTRNVWAFIIPLCLAAMFIFIFIPSLAKHLQSKYPDQYESWVKNTKAFIPFLY